MMKIRNKILTTCSVVTVISIVLGSYENEIRTTERGLMLIGNAEGCIAEPYKCPSDVLTVGIGSTQATAGKITDKVYSNKEIAERWIKDIQSAEYCVNRYAQGDSMPLSTFEAVTSVTFNVGCEKLKYSTMYRKANRHDWLGVCKEIPRWKYSGGKVLPGLVKRRTKEQDLCLIDLIN